MPIPTIAETIRRGPELFAWVVPLLRMIPGVLLVAALRYYFGGASNKAERKLHGKVFIVTGGTSGIGGAAVRALAARGAQLVLLTRQPPSDPFVAEYVEDLRAATGNELVYAEQVDLGSLRSIRAFATRWIDNAPPRRLDGVLLCAATLNRGAPNPKRPFTSTADGVEPCWGINYLANFHLLSILSPALRAQPPDRDVRVVVATCGAYTRGDMRGVKDSRAPLPVGKEFGTSKLALMTFARAFQRHLDAYARPDKKPNNTRVMLVDPGLSRTPGTTSWLTAGSLWGLLIYILLWPVAWVVLKSPDEGAQTILTAVLDAELGQGVGARLFRECKEIKCKRPEVDDDKAAEELWKFSERQIMALEKEDAAKRARLKKKDKAQMGAVVEEIIEEEEPPKETEIPKASTKKGQGKVLKRR